MLAAPRRDAYLHRSVLVRTARSRSTLTMLLGSTLWACGGNGRVYVEIPEDVDYLAILSVDDVREPLGANTLLEATGIESAASFSQLRARDAVVVGWSEDVLRPILPAPESLISSTTIRLRGESELLEALPVPGWQVGVSSVDAKVRAVKVPELTADWRPRVPVWSRLTPSTEPRGRYSADLAEDVARARLVMFGGLAEPRGGALNDTWLFEGGRWRELVTEVRPAARSNGALEPDPLSGEIILFGGHGVRGRLNDTWRLDGTEWTRLELDASPPARTEHDMVLDPIRGQIVLFGGKADGYLNDTWVFDGRTWVELALTDAPPARSKHAMFFHEARGAVVMLGGQDGNLALSDAWQLVGDDWRPLPAFNLPGPRGAFAVSYDPMTERVIMFGGTDETSGSYEGTWVFDGAWRLLEDRSRSPSARGYPAMAREPSPDTLILFGGVHWGVFEERVTAETYRLALSR